MAAVRKAVSGEGEMAAVRKTVSGRRETVAVAVRKAVSGGGKGDDGSQESCQQGREVMKTKGLQTTAATGGVLLLLWGFFGGGGVQLLLGEHWCVAGRGLQCGCVG